jgi:hypothetical protein
MFQRSISILYLFAALLASESYSQQKHALLVGVGDHIYPVNNLRGPKNDVPAMQKLLIEKYGFKPENIEILQDANATRSNIIAAFERGLIAPVSERDLALFYFTGHGTQVTDYSGDESDKRDEAFLPYDGRTISTLLVDDDLDRLINRIKTRNVVVILDACHSGTGTRGLARPKRVTAKDLGIEDAPAPEPSNHKNHKAAKELANALVITAAREDQIAADYPFLFQASDKSANANMGVLTYYLLQEAWGDQNNELTYEALTERVRTQLENNGFGQTPQIEGVSESPFLMLAADTTAPAVALSTDSVTILTPEAHAEVVAVDKHQVTIQAIGAVQLVRGSIFETVEQAIDNEPNAVRVIESNGQKAMAEVITGRIETGDRLVETFHFIPHSNLRLAVVGDSSLAPVIEKKMTAFDFVKIVKKDEFREVEFEVTPGASSFRITPYRNQHRLPDLEISNVDSTVAKTRPLLENLFAVTQLANLQNPNPPFNVDVQVNGKDYDEIRVGKEVAFTVRTDRDAYVYLVDVDPAGKMTVLFPNMYAKENFLNAGMVYEMPAQNLYRLQVGGPAGPELVKAIATTKPLNLEILSSDSGEFNSLNESAVEVAKAIADQLKREVNRLSTRGISVLPAAPVEQPISTEGWATDEVLLRVVE